MIIVGAGVGLGLTLLGGSSSITAHGELVVQDYFGDCQNAFPDISNGTQVVATDSAGAVIGTGSLSYSASASNTLSAGDSGTQCVYDFTVAVPGGLPRYGLTVSHRGTIYFSAAQMSQGPNLTLCTGNADACN